MSAAMKALESASRRELQALAKELQLCRGNSKSDVIVGHAVEFLNSHPKDGEKQVLGALSSSNDSPTPTKEKKSPKGKKESPKPTKESPKAKKESPKPTKESPKAKKESPKPKKESPKPVKETTVVTKVESNGKKNKKKQPEDEPSISDKSVEIVETKKKNVNETKIVTPKDKKKAKQPPAKTSKVSVKVTSIKTLQETVTVTTKSSTSKTKASENEKKLMSSKKEEPVVAKKPTSTGKKAGAKTHKTVEGLVESLSDLTFVGETRVRCSTTGHEMKADLNVINAYISGKRYQKARNLKQSFAKYAPMFVDHQDETKTEMLWCNVTESAIARDLKRVQEHIAAPKYQKELPIWKEQEAAKKKALEEAAQRRAARIEAAKKRRLAADEEGAAKSKRPAKRTKTVESKDRKK